MLLQYGIMVVKGDGVLKNIKDTILKKKNTGKQIVKNTIRDRNKKIEKNSLVEIPSVIFCSCDIEIEGSYVKIYLNTKDEIFVKILMSSIGCIKKQKLGKIQFDNNRPFLAVEFNIINDIHSAIYLLYKGSRINLIDIGSYNLNNKLPKMIARTTYLDNFIALRTNVDQSMLILTVVPKYEGADQKFIKDFILAEKTKDIIFFYEKKSMTYGESSFVLFDKYYRENKDFYFILSIENPDFYKLKEKYGKQLIQKGSEEFYRKLASVKLLVSSELPPHLLSDRCIEYEVIDYIYKIPFIFLQHGIMLAKPILNPMARGFWKENIKYNLVKTVVSSELEKEEFFKVGYNENDLIKTGLASFDQKNMNSTKDKFVYMPTYRHWEEFDVYNGDIENTSYYIDIISVIAVFKSIGMEKNLVIVPHPKFASYMKKNCNFECEIEESYTNLRDEILVYITDFSSASFDAHYRGAYVIYLWNNRRILEKNYRSKSPLNEYTTDGVPVYDFAQLKYEIIHAINQEFVMDDYYVRNFNKIVEFNDGCNSKRILYEVKKIMEEIDAE